MCGKFVVENFSFLIFMKPLHLQPRNNLTIATQITHAQAIHEMVFQRSNAAVETPFEHLETVINVL